MKRTDPFLTIQNGDKIYNYHLDHSLEYDLHLRVVEGRLVLEHLEVTRSGPWLYDERGWL